MSIGNSAAVNIGVQVAFPITAFSGQKPGVGLMDHVVVLFSVLLSLFFGAGGFFFFFFSVRAIPAGYGSSQASVQLRSAAAVRCHSPNQILNPLSDAGEKTHILMDPRQVLYH